MTGPAVDSGPPAEVSFFYPDPDRRLAGVTLHQGVGIDPAERELRYDEGARGWKARARRPPVGRMEYAFALHHPDGDTEVVRDPANPSTTLDADRSVLEFPGYAPPWWLAAEQVAPGDWRDVPLASAYTGEVTARVWSPSAPSRGLLVAHDGPAYERLAAVDRFAAAVIGTGRVPPFSVALLPAADRNRWYAAEPEYADALAGSLLPRLHAALGTRAPAVGMGASLGALAMLHAQRRRPGAFGALFLQSGSFFVPAFDRHEGGFSGYPRIVAFVRRVRRVARRGPAAHPVPTVLTCGAAEENLRNNRVMADALRAQGYPAALHEVADAHNFVGWRDALDPYLTELLGRVWSDVSG